jgi:hypothetical protein
MWKTVKVDEQVYNALVALQGFIQMTEKRKVSLNDVIKDLLIKADVNRLYTTTVKVERR